MGLNMENAIRFNSVHRTIVSLAESLRHMGEGMANASHVKGDEEDTTALIFLDVPNFMTFNKVEKEMFEEAVHGSDGVNVFIMTEQMIRFTFAILNYWNREEDPYKTDVMELKRKKEKQQ